MFDEYDKNNFLSLQYVNMSGGEYMENISLLHDWLTELLYVQEVVTQPKISNRTILYNLVHVT